MPNPEYFTGRTSVFVQSVLRSIASAYKLEGLLPHPRVPSAPHFACVNTDTIRRYRFLDSDPYELCTMPGAPGQAFYVMGTSYIFLCPSFWRGQVEPQRDKNICPSVTNNRFLDGGETLAGYASYLLIHEMVHFYLQAASLGIYTHPPEIYPINYCVGLDAMNSIRNPQNYQFYVASKSCHYLLKPDWVTLTKSSGASEMHRCSGSLHASVSAGTIELYSTSHSYDSGMASIHDPTSQSRPC